MRALIAARAAGAIAGVGTAAVAVGSWQIPRGPEAPAASLTMQIGAVGELAVTPVGELLAAPRLRVGAPHAARFSIRNQTASELRVRLAADSPERGLDGPVHAEVTVDGGRVASVSLGQLRRGVTLGRLRSGGTRDVAVRVTLDADAPGVQADFRLALTAKAVG